MDRYIMVSSDCHAGAPWELLRGYVDRAYRDDYDRWLADYLAGDPRFRPMTEPKGVANQARIEAEQAVKEGGRLGSWNPDIRLRELDREGIAAEIMFPLGQNRDVLPFGMWSITGGDSYSLEHHWAIARAHNRWLAELCATAPDRHYGLALILPQDVEAAVTEIRWARKAGLAGGITFPGLSMLTNDPEKFWHHPRHEPIWAACEELAMPLQIHVGGEMPNYGPAPGARWIQSMEVFWTTRRPIWHLIWGGVLERHPGLRLSTTESGGTWLPAVLELMDHLYDIRNPEAARALLPLRPSEYWHRQCAIGASPPAGRSLVDMRGAIGLENIMWGSDYPHHEGTWPKSIERLKEMFAGVPVAEVRKMVGENAARHCGIDLKKLESIAARIGPAITDFGGEAAVTVPAAPEFAYVVGRGG